VNRLEPLGETQSPVMAVVVFAAGSRELA